jgi:hypothetical protein
LLAIRYLRGGSVDSDTMNFFDLPANARIHYALLQASDMDTNGTRFWPSTSAIRDRPRAVLGLDRGPGGHSCRRDFGHGAGFAADLQDPDHRHGVNQRRDRRCGHCHLTVLYSVEG